MHTIKWFIHIVTAGDRIAIISQGSLLCCGSFEYLKTKFGRGHELTLVTNTQSERRHSTSSRTIVIQADVEETDHTSVVENHTPLPPICMDDAVDRITNFIKVRITDAVVMVFIHNNYVCTEGGDVGKILAWWKFALFW